MKCAAGEGHLYPQEGGCTVCFTCSAQGGDSWGRKLGLRPRREGVNTHDQACGVWEALSGSTTPLSLKSSLPIWRARSLVGGSKHRQAAARPEVLELGTELNDGDYL